MKRDPAFIALSREHHDGLLLAVRLQQGPRALERLWSHDPKWQAEYVVDFFEKHLGRHFKEEEQFLFPEVAGMKSHDPVMLAALLEDHREMRTIAGSLAKTDAALLGKALARFGEILEQHIRREERELFVFCEAAMSGEQLSRLNSVLNH